MNILQLISHESTDMYLWLYVSQAEFKIMKLIRSTPDKGTYDPITEHAGGNAASSLIPAVLTFATTLQFNPTQQDNIHSGQDRCMPMQLTT